MKKTLLFAALTIGALPLQAETAPNRENIGDVPTTAPVASDKPSGAGEGETASEKSPDEPFFHKAGKAGHMEVRVAELAVGKASREDLKAFAAMLVKDHSAANAELASIAKSLGVEIHRADHETSGRATPANDPSGRQQTEVLPKDPSKPTEADPHKELQDKTGTEFDTAFMEAMEKCHKEDIALFEKSVDTVKSPVLKTFIEKTLPIIKSHAAALPSLKRKDPNRPEARSDSASPTPVSPVPDLNGPNR